MNETIYETSGKNGFWSVKIFKLEIAFQKSICLPLIVILSIRPRLLRTIYHLMLDRMCVKLFQIWISNFKVEEWTMFKIWILSVTLTLKKGAWLMPRMCAKLFQIWISKFEVMRCTIFDLWTLTVTLTFNIGAWLLHATHLLMYVCEIILDSFH